MSATYEWVHLAGEGLTHLLEPPPQVYGSRYAAMSPRKSVCRIVEFGWRPGQADRIKCGICLDDYAAIKMDREEGEL